MSDLEYAIAGTDDPETLELRVAQMIREGWEPLGGVAVVFRQEKASLFLERKYSVFYQAMIRRAKDWRES